jgi:hypothetical protein
MDAYLTVVDEAVQRQVDGDDADRNLSQGEGPSVKDPLLAPKIERDLNLKSEATKHYADGCLSMLFCSSKAAQKADAWVQQPTAEKT